MFFDAASDVLSPVAISLHNKKLRMFSSPLQVYECITSTLGGIGLKIIQKTCHSSKRESSFPLNDDTSHANPCEVILLQKFKGS